MIDLPESRSYWMDTAPAPDRRGARLPAEADVAVLGAGIAGLTTACLLADAGRSVVVIEAREVASGVSGNTTAKLTAQHGLMYHGLASRKGSSAARRYAAAQQAAVEWIDQGRARLGIDCEFVRRDSFVYATHPARLSDLAREAEAARRAGLPATLEHEVDLPFAVAGAVRFADQAQFHPRRWLLGLAGHIESRGGRVVEGVRVVDVDERPSPVVHTTHGDIAAGDVVVATHYPLLDRGLFFARLEPVRDLVVAGPAEFRPAGMFLDADTRHSLRTAGPPGHEVVIVGGEHYRTGEHVDVRGRHERLAAWAEDAVGMRAVTHRWSAHDLSTMDGVPYVGRYHPAARHLWVATGFGQWGMTGGTGAGLLLADLLLGADNEAAAVFDPNRFDVRSVPKLLGANATVARHFLGDRLRAGATGAGELAPDTARVVREGTRWIAEYRTPEGEIRAVDATCTHLGCVVAFNNAERTWDCPCHASRFALDGSVLHGPASKPLRQITPTPVSSGGDGESGSRRDESDPEKEE